MIARVRTPSCLALTILIAGSLFAQDDEKCRRVLLFAVDPVELIAGAEKPGHEALSVTRGVFTYRFSSPDNMAKFERDPEKYEVQLGGSCGRMGPLSGIGRADIFAVYKDRIYVFASKQCRTSFLKAPDSLLETDDAPVKADDAARKRGRELIDLAVKAAGGADRIDAIKTYRQRSERTENLGGTEYKVGDCLALGFPDRLRHEQSWNDWVGGEVALGKDAHFISAGEGLEHPLALAPQQRRAVQRIVNRNLLAIFRARTRADFVAAETGAARIEQQPAALVTVSFDGSTATLAIDPQNGRVLAIRHSGRGPTLAIGEIERRFTEHRTVGGVTLPAAWKTTFNGEPFEKDSCSLSTLEIDVELPDEYFRAPVKG